MTFHLRAVVLTLSVLGCALSAVPVHAAEVKLFCANAMIQVIGALAGEFERSTGHKLSVIYGPAGDIRNRIENSEAADVAILPAGIVSELISKGSLMAGSVAVASVGVGVAVRTGSPKPDIGSPEALKLTLLAARSISHGDLVSGGVSGPHFMRVLERLGITAEVDAKRKVSTGLAVAQRVANGESELAINQISELVGVPGVDFVGPLPQELQNTTFFSMAIFANAREPEAARLRLAFLVSAAARDTIRSKGMDAATR